MHARYRPRSLLRRPNCTDIVLTTARQAFFVASGDSKAEALRKVLPREWGGMREEVAEASQLPAARYGLPRHLLLRRADGCRLFVPVQSGSTENGLAH